MLQLLTTSTYDAFDKQVQQEIVEQLQEAGGAVQSMIIADLIQLNERERNIRYGLYKRSVQDPATKYKWTDPKEANGVPIFARQPVSETDPNNKLHTPFDVTIITNKSSYLAGKPMEFTVNIDVESTKYAQQEIVTQLAKDNYFDSLNSSLVSAATRSGAGYVILYKPEGSTDTKIRPVNEWECIVIYDESTGQPVYGIRYYPEIDIQQVSETQSTTETKWVAEWYTGTDVTIYEGFGTTFSVRTPAEPHLLGTIENPFVPLVEFRNNYDRVGDVAKVIPLMDAFDTADSNLSSDIDKFANAFLHITGAGFDFDDESIATMMRTHVIATDDNGKADYISRQIDIEGIERFKDGLERRIYKYANSYDPDSLGSDGAKTAYEIAQKLKPLEDASKLTELQFKQSWYYVLRGINNFNATANKPLIDVEALTISFQRNVPRNVMQDLKDLRAAGGVLSQENIIKQSPFDIDTLTNAEQLKQELENNTIGLTDTE